MTRELSFERNKTGNLVIIFASVCVVALALWIMSLSSSDLLKIGSGAAHPLISLFSKYPTLVHITAAVAIFFALTLGIIHTWKDYLDKTPGLLLNAAGLTDAHYDHKESLGPIPWSEIVNFYVDSSNNRLSLVVDLANPSKYLQVGTLNRRTNSKRHMDEYGSPIVIGSRHLKLDLIKVEESCKSILLHIKMPNPTLKRDCAKAAQPLSSTLGIPNMKNITIAVTFLFCISNFANAESSDLATSESRDASTAYLGTVNFVVGRVGRDCLTLLNRPETPQAFVTAWQQRNSKYLMASQKYIAARLAEAEASGGTKNRDAIMTALTISVRNGAESIVKSWLDRPDKSEACKFAVALIESGKYDISETSPMFGELESLVSWAQ